MTSWRLDTLRGDLSLALRNARRNPGYALGNTATLTLGIGAVTAIFSILSGVLLRPLPYSRPEGLVQLGQDNSPDRLGPVFYSDLLTWRQRASSFSGFSAFWQSGRNLYGAGEPERLQTIMAERNLFDLLGAPPVAGRTFRLDDPPNVAVISAGLWKRRFGGSRAVLGRTVTLDREPYTVIGVMPDTFQFPYRATQTELWLPWAMDRGRALNPNSRLDSVVGRVRQSVPFERARSELTAISPRPVRLVRLAEHVEGGVRPALLTLFGAAALLWLATCANAANMLLAQASRRTHEMAVRTALGAGRGRLMRQLLAESLLLSGCAGVAGLVLGYGGTRLLLKMAASRIPRAWEIAFDWRVFGFLVAASVVTGVAFGLIPAFTTSRADPMSALKTAARLGGRGKAGRLIRNALAAFEIGLSFVLLIGAGLLMEAFLRLRNTPTGLEPGNVLTLRMTHSNADYRAPGSYGRYVQRLEQRIAQVTGVRAAGFIQYLPLRNSGWTGGFSIEGRPRVSFESPEHPKSELRYVSPGYFKTMGIPLRAGRYLTERDTPDAPMVILVNEALARRYFPNEDPVGRKTDRGVIVGVVGDVRSVQLDQPAVPEIYYSFAQNTAATSDAGVSLVVDSIPPADQIARAVREAIHAVNPMQAVFGVSTMRGVIAESLADANAYVWLMGIFAGLALAIAVSGVYGVVALLVASRQREFAIRRALGANGFRIVRLVFAYGLGSVVWGLAWGGIGIWAVATSLRSLVSGVRAVGLAEMAAAGAVLGAAALIACAGPARHAARVDPQSALREE